MGKNANCQTLVSVTLASSEVPVMIGLKLFLPESWTSDAARMDRAKVPEEARDYRTKPEIALAEIDRVRGAGVRFGGVLADAGYTHARIDSCTWPRPPFCRQHHSLPLAATGCRFRAVQGAPRPDARAAGSALCAAPDTPAVA